MRTIDGLYEADDLATGQATMATTMVGIDWGLAALGVRTARRQPDETDGTPTWLVQRFGEHAVITTGSYMLGHDGSAGVNHKTDQVVADEPHDALDLPDHARDSGRPIPLDALRQLERLEIIHAVHGVTAEGEWFLLADLTDVPSILGGGRKPCGRLEERTDQRLYMPLQGVGTVRIPSV